MGYLECNELWVPVYCDDKYEVSNKGRVRRKKDKRLIHISSRDPRGYQNVHLSGKTCYLHRIVAGSFWDDDPAGYDINHLDGNKQNNDIRNLEICTRQENIIHAFRTGLKTNKRTK